MIQATLPIPALSDSDKERFFAKVSTVPTSAGCLEWTALKDKTGYGRLNVGGKMLGSHRIAYSLATGIDPYGFLVCHHCDNPSCCSISHLFLGTASDNMTDKALKGRGNAPRGESHSNAKLTATDIPLIRADTRFQRVIAAEYGVDQSIISDIKRRKYWAHI